jgi:pilus assembly protein Flp/PilA
VNSLETTLQGRQQQPGKAGKAAAGYGFRCSYQPPYGEIVMNKIASAVKAFVADENGVTAIEYGLIAAVIGLAMAVGAKSLGTDISSLFTSIGGKLTAATTPTPAS